MPTKDEMLAENVRDVLDRGPRLRTGRNTWIEARDTRGYVLKGGLGAMGVGTMWFAETERDRSDPTYAEAPIILRRCESYESAAGPIGFPRTCELPHGHDGAHHVGVVALQERSW
jgi:hypothetical protein